MTLAEAYEIEVPDHGFVCLTDGVPAVVQRRFDLMPDGSKYRQDDMTVVLSANGHEITKQYDSDYETVSKAIGALCGQNAAKENFRRIFFSMMIKNNDMHLRNMAVIYCEGSCRLTPMYDVVNVTLVLPQATDALSIEPYANRTNYDNITIDDIEILGGRLGISKQERYSIYKSFFDKEADFMRLIQASPLDAGDKIKFAELLENSAQRFFTESITNIHENWRISREIS
jgi:serine/threonine-protein kinase HipA